ncbi:MAG: hypothetical protein E2O68_04910 [Deltaproteobacteria bacterium]|nr:MAG: hypothetical protein E2O68_04910 [Deltaproteobacteria bacterium]
MKIMILFLLMFVCACHGEAPKKIMSYPGTTSKGEMSALEHLQKAKDILRNEEGHLMIMGRSHTDEEQKRYEVLLSSGKALAEIIDILQNSGPN